MNVWSTVTQVRHETVDFSFFEGSDEGKFRVCRGRF